MIDGQDNRVTSGMKEARREGMSQLGLPKVSRGNSTTAPVALPKLQNLRRYPDCSSEAPFQQAPFMIHLQAHA